MSQTLTVGRVQLVLQVVHQMVQICQMQKIMICMPNSASSLYNLKCALSDSFGERE